MSLSVPAGVQVMCVAPERSIKRRACGYAVAFKRRHAHIAQVSSIAQKRKQESHCIHPWVICNAYGMTIVFTFKITFICFLLKGSYMSKITIMEAVKLISVSESTLRRDMKTGKVSFEVSNNGKGHKLVDVAELQRVYKFDVSMNGNGLSNEGHLTGNDSQKIVDLLESQLTETQDQLKASAEREANLLKLAERLQKQNEVLMLPPPAAKVFDFWGLFKKE